MARAQEPQAMGHEQEAVFEWVPHRPSGGPLRVSHTSCCGWYEWGCEGGSFFVLRSIADGYQETGRGRYRRALDVYIALAEAHNAEHVRRGETPEPDTFLPQKDGAANREVDRWHPPSTSCPPRSRGGSRP